MKKHWIRLLTFCVILSCFSGCSAARRTAADPLVKRADHLYEITYTDDFNWDQSSDPDLSGFSCSGVQNGNYRGRNYDWTYADTDLCVVHATVTEQRPHASVGVADLSFINRENGVYDCTSLPFATVDGINDAGVCIQVNVMPYGENGVLEHTETTLDDLAAARVNRYILDYADSVEGALALLQGKDIHTEIGTAEEVHWMLTGPASASDPTLTTVVIEVFPDGLHITRDFVDDKPIMTNFNVANFDGTAASVGIGLGYERWQILNENYAQADSVMGTFDLMEKVFFSKMYDLYGDRFWYSEYNGVDLSGYYDAETLKTLLGEDVYDFYMDTYGGVYYTAELWDGETALHGTCAAAGILAPVVRRVTDLYRAQNTQDGSLWITIHTTVYDLENRTLDLQVRESQDHFRFTIG